MRFMNGFASVALLVSMAQAQTAYQPMVKSRPPANTIVKSNEYVLIAWNDLGMHCMSPKFGEICILPPYNTIRAIVIRRGKEPEVVTENVSVSYWMDNNTTFVGKTDFWTFAPKLFGTNVPAGIGLTGNGLSGPMKRNGKIFEATGVPVTPLFDNKTWNPYQRATVGMSVGKGQPIKNITSVVVPVSDELNCGKCHKSGGSAAKNIATPTIDGNILTLHDQRHGTKLMQNRPVLCASCHADVALGAPGKPGIPNMSLAMHGRHANLPAARQPSCYDCHPGTKTHCNRSALKGMGPVGDDPKCASCHGDLAKMAKDLKNGRQPWTQEPNCAQCHGKAYSTGTTPYKEARGHGGVMCVACHNSPHAWYPSQRADDNMQPMALQGNARAIGYKACNVCHTGGRTGTVPPHNDD